MIAATAPTLASFPQDHPCWRLHNKDAQVITTTSYILLSRSQSKFDSRFSNLIFMVVRISFNALLVLEGFEGPHNSLG